MHRFYSWHFELAASLGYYVFGVFVAISTDEVKIPLSAKLGLLSLGALAGSGYFIFRSLSVDGTKNFPARMFEVFANCIVAIVVGALLVEFLNYRYSLSEQAAAGQISLDAVLFGYVGIAFLIVAIGQAGIKWFVALIKEILLSRLKK